MAQPKSAFLAVIGQQAGTTGRANKYDPVYCDIIKYLARNGEFPETWACTIGVSLETIRVWGTRYPDFKDALIISKHLLASFWTRDIASNRKNPSANSAMYGFLVRRMPALFGKDPVDLADWVTAEAGDGDISQTDALSSDQVKAAPTADLEARLEVLIKRRDEAEKK